MESFFVTWQPRVLSILRIVTAFMFMQHGGQKLFGYPAAQRYEFDLFTLSGVAGVLELVGGFLILIGLFTRPVAFILSGQMAVAYFIAHAPQAFWPLLNNGELAALFSFIFLYLFVAGGGAWSVDNVIKRQS
ncbi:DoxX family protein [Methylophaga pinxianii]|uniref:DoxX family protein n=1 Tax=Methylophaga pinxianii TaxID=2881052 RepID=UPI001CF5C6A7|nr:DoxX family protein [Methylophaga pinxianii]MCB2427609.1 DoxX family protein [Methylophaga pinxianii]UPH46600.1 DoxX family protein [Methylophaga pinxianii]